MKHRSSLATPSRDPRLAFIQAALPGLLSAFLLAGCAAPPSSEQRLPTQAPAQASPAQLEAALAEALASPIDQRASRLLDVMAAAITNGQAREARQISNLISASLLSINEARRLEALTQNLLLLEGSEDVSDEKLLSLPPAQRDRLPPSLQARLIGLQANQLLTDGKPLESIQLRVRHSGLFTGERLRENNDAIWSGLQSLTSTQTSPSMAQPVSADLQGWFELSAALQTGDGNSLEARRQALGQWLSTHPEHPAARALPTELAMLQQMADYRPNRITLLLPLSGTTQKAGEAIRDGFLAAFLDVNPPDSAAQIEIVDSSAHSDIQELYLTLQLQGTDLIVGPLEKEKVEQLALLPDHQPPVLALNYIAESPLPRSHFYQFGLAVEDELTQILSELQAQSLRRILVIASNSPWSQKLLVHLEGQARALGLTILGVETFSDDAELSVGIAEQLLIPESQNRARALQSLLGKMETEPRRRQDVDAMVLLTSPTYARQIKPLLAFHYASELPVYATSQIYSGTRNPVKDADLNGIRMPELPWILNQTLDIRRQAESHLSPGYSRFFAMGWDAYQLATRLHLLERFDSAHLQGQTGYLRLSKDRQIRRELDWAVFDAGVLTALPRSGRASNQRPDTTGGADPDNSPIPLDTPAGER